MPDLNDQIRSYFDEIDPPFTLAELMREPRRTQHPRRIMTARAFTLTAGAAVAVLMLIGGPLLLLRGATDVDVQPLAPVVLETTTAPSTTIDPRSPREQGVVFDFTEHDLCEWFAPDEIRGFVADAYRAEGLTYPIPTELVADPPEYASPQWGCSWGAVGAIDSPSLVTFDVSFSDMSNELAEHEELIRSHPGDWGVNDLLRDGIVLLQPSDVPNVYVADPERLLFIGHIPAGEPDVDEATFDDHVGRWLGSIDRQRVQIRILNAMLEGMNWLPDTSTGTTTTTPADLPEVLHEGPYESVGYSCGDDPTTGCDGDLRLSVTSLWIGTDNPNGPKVDFIDFHMNVQTSPEGFERSDLIGDVDDPVHAELGTGIRVVQLDSPPAGLDIAGEAWMEVTISSVSAGEFATRPAARPVVTTPMTYRAPTHLDPIIVAAVDATTHLIEETVLVATTDDMMQWIVVFNQPGTYLVSGGYWIGSGAPHTLNLSFYRD
ncbi:MAG: hypothetical protein U9N79_00385 [Actinomycetota bacterium]|nr:hypothetical protein [Actinomycetota bacterium]